MTIYTPQMLNTFKNSPEKYYEKFVLNLSEPQLDSNFLVGKNLHALAAYHLLGKDTSIFTLTANENKMWETLINSEYFQLEPVQVEYNITTKIHDFWVGGRLDSLVKNADKDYFILDYKTGKIPQEAENDFQTMIYLLCCDNLLKEYKSLTFVYLSLKTGEEKVIEYSKKLGEVYAELIVNTCHKIQSIS